MVLGFDTATSATVVALLDPATETAVEARDDPDTDPAHPQRPRHMAALLTLVDRQMRAVGVSWADIERLAVGVGPGTFTGLRIGVATAQALARAREIELVGVSTLHALALAAARSADAARDDAALAVIDGRRGEVFAAGWGLTEVGDARAEPLLAPQAIPVGDLADALRERGRSWVAAGDGSVAFKAALERSGARIPTNHSGNRVSAIEHCRLALGLSPEPPEGVRPEYIRLPDAEINLGAA